MSTLPTGPVLRRTEECSTKNEMRTRLDGVVYLEPKVGDATWIPLQSATELYLGSLKRKRAFAGFRAYRLWLIGGLDDNTHR